MSARLRPAARSACVAAGLALLVACAARTAPPPPAGVSPLFPDFVFPAPPHGDAATATRQETAWRWLQAGDLRTAEREFGAILRRQPGFTPAESGLAYVLLARRQPQDALSRFGAALSRDPGYAPALVGRAQALLALGRDEEALKSLEAAAAADPSLDLGPRIEVLRFRSIEDRIGAARRAAEQGRLDEARAAYAQAIAMSPDSAFLLRELAVVENSAGMSDAAVEHLRKAAALDPSEPRTHVLLGDVLAGQGDLEAAARAYEAAQALEPAPETAAKLEAARARADLARLPAPYHAIPSLAEVTRGDVAAVLGVRLADLLSTARGRQGVLVTDVRGHWAAPWILAVVRAGVMEPLPNHTFQPHHRVRRVDLAQIASRALTLISSRRPASAATWQSARVTISDVGPGHPTYPAVSQVVAAGVLPLAGDVFAPTRGVSGAELVAAVERLRDLAAAGARRPL